MNTNFCVTMDVFMGLETAENKIQEICEKLRKETLDPARNEARHILESAERRAEQIVEEAKKKAELSREETKKDFESQKSVNEVALDLAIKQAISKLQQEVMKVFSTELTHILQKETEKPHVIAEMLTALLRAVEKDGLNGDLKAILPKALPLDALLGQLAEGVRQRLQKGNIILGDFTGGAALKLVDRKMVIDMSDKALKELLSSYAQEGLREKIFNA